ncbi:PREDICTED: uncharacterized protein LOC105557485, partial [Vollenhovia emeryi]|uniref:uncharacterized protein LOC105557485 n=1 Tax=Vollenhovia emeryi TaxID=411798 RepID=UPI0005F40668
MQMATNTQLATKICIESQHSGFKANLDCLVLPRITERLPQFKLDRMLLNISRDQRLADPNFDKPGTIDLLIGAGLFWNLLCVGQIKMSRGSPIWQKTQLGWIIGGELIDAKPRVTSTSLLIVNKSLNEQVERFWTQEEVPELRQLTTQERYCEEQFISTLSRDPTGRFVVSLPKNEAVTIGSSREVALQRFKALERRFKRQPNRKEDYVRFMEEYERQGHMEPVDGDTLSENGLTCFLPHHSVLRPDHLTTKVRVVFDASAKTSSGRSLNDMLLARPNLQNDLMHILLRFRLHKYVITADIAMMFRQILVNEEDRRLQLIIWRKSEDLPIGTYALKTVTYGTNCAPYLAMRCLRQLASENKDQHPQTAR